MGHGLAILTSTDPEAISQYHPLLFVGSICSIAMNHHNIPWADMNHHKIPWNHPLSPDFPLRNHHFEPGNPWFRPPSHWAKHLVEPRWRLRRTKVASPSWSSNSRRFLHLSKGHPMEIILYTWRFPLILMWKKNKAINPTSLGMVYDIYIYLWWWWGMVYYALPCFN